MNTDLTAVHAILGGEVQDILVGDSKTILFNAGKLFIQHDEQSVADYKAALVKLSSKIFKHPCFEKPLNEIHPLGLCARLINDSGAVDFDRAWNRLACIDNKWREWQQPYFVNNPDETATPQLLAISKNTNKSDIRALDI